MSIFVLNSQTQQFLKLEDSLSQYIDLDVFEDEKELISALESEGDAVLINLDSEPKQKDKLIKKLKSKYKDLPIFGLCNELDPKKMAKHQKSKYGLDLYFRTPVNDEVLLNLLSEYFEIDKESSSDDQISIDMRDTNSDEVRAVHEAPSALNREAQEVSEHIDDVVSSVLVSDYLEEAPSENLEEDEALSFDEENLDEISLDDENPDSIELTLGEEDMNFNLEEDEADSFQDVNIDQSDDETLFPADDDLEFPDVMVSNESPISEESLQGEAVEDTLDEEFSIELSESSPIEDNSQPEPEELLVLDEGTIDPGELSFDIEESLELSIDDSEPISSNANEDENALDFNLDFDEIETKETDEDLPDNDILSLSNDEQQDSSEQDEINALEFGFDEGGAESSLDIATDDLEENIELASDVDNHEVTKPISTKQMESLALEVDTEDYIDNNTATILGVSIESDIDSMIEQGSEQDNEQEVDLSADAFTTDSKQEADDFGFIDDQAKSDDDSPEFSTTVERKIEEIDNMLMEEEFDDAEDEVSLPDSPPSLFLSEDEDATKIIEVDSVEDDTVQTQIQTQVEPRANATVSQEKIASHNSFVQNHDEELVRLGETIKTLREDRDHWIAKCTEFEENKNEEKNDFLRQQAELDEKKIEIAILKKRYTKKIEELKYQLDISDDRKETFKLKSKQLEQEVELLSKKSKVDVHLIRARERELEEKLEMLKSDSEIQIRNRDHKILELKRRVDTLEFDIESSHMKEQQTTSGKHELENKMEKVIQTLRSAINHLEDDDGNAERLSMIKKSLDV